MSKVLTMIVFGSSLVAAWVSFDKHQVFLNGAATGALIAISYIAGKES